MTLEVPRLSTFVLKTCSEVGIMLAQRRGWWPSITLALDQCIMLSGVSGWKASPHNNSAVRKHCRLQSPHSVSMSGQRRRLWVNIETALAEFQYMPKVYSRPSD